MPCTQTDPETSEREDKARVKGHVDRLGPNKQTRTQVLLNAWTDKRLGQVSANEWIQMSHFTPILRGPDADLDDSGSVPFRHLTLILYMYNPFYHCTSLFSQALRQHIYFLILLYEKIRVYCFPSLVCCY